MLDSKKYPRQESVSLPDETADKLDNAATRFKVSKSAIIRACIDESLDKLIQRESKRTKRRTN